MPAYRCLGKMTWPCDHEEKHRTAAHLGWHRRRHGLRVNESGHRALESLGFKRAHTDPSHRGFVRFHEGGEWHELPRAAFNELVNVAKAEARDAKREQAKAAKASAKNAREEERGRKAEAKNEEEGERNLRVWEKASHAEVVKWIKASGGIRPNRIPSGSSAKRPPEYEEWQELPKQLRVNSRDSRRGMALDDMADEIKTVFPRLQIENGDDLTRYLKGAQARRRNQQHAAAIKKNQKNLRETAPEPPKAEPAPEPPKPAPAPEPAKPVAAPNSVEVLEKEIEFIERDIKRAKEQHADAVTRGDQGAQKVLETRLSGWQTNLARTKERLRREKGGAAPEFKYVASQKSNGKWIVSKVYKDGTVKQEPKEYASNPIPGPKKIGTQPTRGQSNLFGGEYEKQEISGVGLFD